MEVTRYVTHPLTSKRICVKIVEAEGGYIARWDTAKGCIFGESRSRLWEAVASLREEITNDEIEIAGADS